MGGLKVYFVSALPDNPSDTVLDVHSDADYLAAIHSLEDSSAGIRKELWVRNRYHYSWIQAYAEHAGLTKSHNVEFKQVTARDILSERWGQSLPDWLTDEAIAEEKLLDAKSLKEGMDIPTALLAKKVPAAAKLITKEFPTSHAGTLAEKVCEPEIATSLNSGIRFKAWNAVCERWRRDATNKWQREFVDRLEKDSRRLWSDLTIWSILYKYPDELKGFALDPGALVFLRQLPTESLKEMGLCAVGTEQALDQISHHINRILNSNPDTDTADKVLSQMSGRLEQEFGFVERLFDAVPHAVTTTTLQKIESLFASSVAPESLAKLRLRIQPPEPQAIAEAASAQDWLKWSINEYIPYRSWQVQHNSFDPNLEQIVACFSRWYTDHYAALHSDPELSAIQGLSQWKDQILSDDFSLLLVVDNLPYFFIDAFDQAMRSTGFFLHERNARFVPLPSKTDVSKPMLLSGGPAELADYKRMLSDRSSNEWQKRDVDYFISLKEFRSLAHNNYPRVALLNYLAGDEFLHQNSNKSGVSEDEQLGLLYKALAAGTYNVCRKIVNSGRRVGVYVLTDHGATRLLREESQAVDSTLSKKLFTNQKCRSATMSVEEADAIPSNLWSLGIRFEHSVHSDKVHFIPLGHNTVASSRMEESYFHGGATPEEVIVPFSLYRLQKPELPELGIRIIEPADSRGIYKWYIKRVVAVTLQLQNRYRSACSVLQVRMAPEVGEIRHFDAVDVVNGKSANCRVSLYFQSAATKVSEITLIVDAKYGEEPIQSRITLPVDISSAMSGGLDLKKL